MMILFEKSNYFRGGIYLKYKSIKPTDVTDCFYVDDISGDISLFSGNVAEDLDPADVEHYYWLIEEGTFYPVEPKAIQDRKLVGYFVSKDNEEYICIYDDNGKYVCDYAIGELGWSPIDDVIKSMMSKEGRYR